MTWHPSLTAAQIVALASRYSGRQINTRYAGAAGAAMDSA